MYVVSVRERFLRDVNNHRTPRIEIVKRVLYNPPMSAPILATKLYIPQPRQKVVVRARLREQLNNALQCKLTLISAPAGFGKTTLIAEWLYASGFLVSDLAGARKSENQKSKLRNSVAWLSLDAQDSAPARFLAYLVAALQTILPELGKNILPALQAPQPPPAEAILTALLNEIVAARAAPFILVLDDYHLIDSTQVDRALAFLIEHLPPQMHLIIATRQDPSLALAQLRARNELLELRAADLRFTTSEAAEFLNRVMGLHLTAPEIEQLETRTEGWVVGLQFAAISMRGLADTENFIQSFTGSHRFVLDYLLEQVLQQQTEPIQNFLLSTSILERLCGPLCDAVMEMLAGSGNETLAYLERANLFLFALDDERHWYRYHHLFAELLRQRLQQKFSAAPNDAHSIATLHQRASAWFETNGMLLEAFQHAAAANDVERAMNLLDSERMPYHFPGATHTILNWLNSLPKQALDENPALWWRAAALSLIVGITTGVQEKLQAAEEGLQNSEPTAKTRNLIGRIATARATLALTRYQPETILVQSRRALEYLDANNFPDRTSAQWTQSVAYAFLGERAAARAAVNQAMALAEKSGRNFSLLLATTTSGTLQELDNELAAAVETYRRALQLAGEPALAFASDAHLGLARIFYEWNDLEAAQSHGEASLKLARQYDQVIDRYIISLVFLARLKWAQGDAAGAREILTRAEHDARERNFALRLPEIASAQAALALAQGDIATAARLAENLKQPLLQARVLLAQGNAHDALIALDAYRQFVESKAWQDETLKVLALQAVALNANKGREKGLEQLGKALAMAEPAGFIRLFFDEGEPMRLLIANFRLQIKDQPDEKRLLNYADKLLTAFAHSKNIVKSEIKNQKSEIIVEPLSARELEILQLIAQGHSNQEICERLFLALSTVKGHNRVIFDKLQVKNRTEAVARARALGLI